MKALRTGLMFAACLLAAVSAAASEYARRIETAERAADDGLYDFAEKEALKLYEDDNFPFPDRALAVLVHTAAGQGNRDLVQKRFETLALNYPSSSHMTRARLQFARALLHDSETSTIRAEALETRRRAVQQLNLVLRDASDKSILAQARFFLGVAASRSSDHAEAVSQFSQALQGSLPARTRHLLSYELALSHKELGNYRQALTALEGALEEESPPLIRRNAAFLAGELNYLLTHWKKARKAYLDAVTGAGEDDALSRRARYNAAWSLWKLAETTPSDKRPPLLERAVDEFIALSAGRDDAIAQRAQLKAAHLVLLSGRPVKARAMLAPLLDNAVHGVKAARLSAMAAMEEGDPRSAEKFLRRALRQTRSIEARTSVVLELTGLLREQQRYREAADLLDELQQDVTEPSRKAQLLFDAASLLAQAGEEHLAARRLDAIASNERYARYVPAGDVAYWRAVLSVRKAYRTGNEADFRAAERLLQEFLRQHPDSTRREEATGYLLDLYRASPLQNQKAKGIALVDVLLADTEGEEKISLLKSRAALEIGSGLHSKAAATFALAASLTPETSPVRQGLCLDAAETWVSAREFETALSVLKKFNENPGQPDLLKRYLHLKANVLSRLQQYEQAAETYARLRNLFSGEEDAPAAALQEAQNRLLAGQPQKSREVLKSLDPATPEIRFETHLLAAKAAYTLSEAEECLNQALAALDAAGDDPFRRSLALRYAARARRIHGDSARAYELFARSIADAPEDDKPLLFVEAAEAAFSAARYKEAREAYLQAYYSDPGLIPPASRRNALSGAVEADLQLLLEARDASLKEKYRKEALRLLEAAPESRWKEVTLERLHRLED